MLLILIVAAKGIFRRGGRESESPVLNPATMLALATMLGYWAWQLALGGWA